MRLVGYFMIFSPIFEGLNVYFFTSTRGGYTTDIQLSPYYIIFHKSFDQVRKIVNFAPLIVDDLAF